MGSRETLNTGNPWVFTMKNRVFLPETMGFYHEKYAFPALYRELNGLVQGKKLTKETPMIFMGKSMVSG